jgi:UDP-N-acetylglucosamine--N-acetylmuramyl-(pentapeptide) pyrophosphoryl-undecaprenol N-acetylglucosamine transferase
MSERSTEGVTVIVAGGGTGGHLYPGIALARELLRRRPASRVTFAGTSRGLEARVVPKEGFELDLIRSSGLKGKSIVVGLRGLLQIPLGLIDAWRIVSRRRPDAVVGVGGYSSGPVVFVAALRGVPTMVLEQNAVPGLTNRVLARWVRAAAVTYDESLEHFRGKGFVAGNPVRPEFLDARPRETGSGEPSDARRVMVLGGSQGAHAINVAMMAAAADIVRSLPRLVLVHQTGTRDLGSVRDGYRASGVAARVEPFLDTVAADMKAADLVVCRAGATTLAELAASARPALLVPFPGATDDHQRKNADVLGKAGAAEVLDERDLSGPKLAERVTALLSDPRRLESMGQAMHAFARPDAASRIVDRLFELTGQTPAGERARAASGSR